ncbi:Transcription factor RLM1, partial [Tolypocladium capitatum]
PAVSWEEGTGDRTRAAADGPFHVGRRRRQNTTLAGAHRAVAPRVRTPNPVLRVARVRGPAGPTAARSRRSTRYRSRAPPCAPRGYRPLGRYSPAGASLPVRCSFGCAAADAKASRFSSATTPSLRLQPTNHPASSPPASPRSVLHLSSVSSDAFFLPSPPPSSLNTTLCPIIRSLPTPDSAPSILPAPPPAPAPNQTPDPPARLLFGTPGTDADIVAGGAPLARGRAALDRRLLAASPCAFASIRRPQVGLPAFLALRLPFVSTTFSLLSLRPGPRRSHPIATGTEAPRRPTSSSPARRILRRPSRPRVLTATMGRRKIEIKAIKDDRNRSVTFLKRKGGLFKKAHELSVLCSVDVAVFIFGNNKKLYEYSSSDMHDLIARHQRHGGINEHKGPSDFNGGHDEDEDEDGDATPPRPPEAGVEPQMMPPQFHSQQPPFSQILRHHTPSASPPVANGVPFQGHATHHHPRGATPQPPVASRPSSRNDGRRLGPGAAPQSVGPHGPHGPHPGITYIPTPPIYNPPANQPGMMPQHGGQYSYPPQHQPYMEDRRPPAPMGYATQPPPNPLPVTARMVPSPPRTNNLPPHPAPHMSPPPPHPGHERRPLDAQPPPLVEPRTESSDRPQPPLLNTDAAIKKLPQRKSHSIFTPIEENRSILSQHLASFAAEPQAAKGESGQPAGANRSRSADPGASRDGAAASPRAKRSSTQSSHDKGRNPSVSSGPESAFTPPSRSSSLKPGGPIGGPRPRGPRLTVQIPDGGSEPGSATGESNSPHNRSAVTPTHAPQRHGSHSSVVLPPPSPSASALLSAGATGPPNPFARPPPQQTVNGDTPVTALPSRFLNNELLPSPSSFYPDWNFRGGDGNTLPSPLNFATPVVGSGPSFLRDDGHRSPGNNNNNNNNNNNGGAAATSAAPANGGSHAGSNQSGPMKRKSPDYGPGGQGEGHAVPLESKRLKVDYA